MLENIRITVIICTYNRAKCVERLLRHLSMQLDPQVELIVVDSSNNDQTQNVVRQVGVGNYYRCDKGLTRQRKFGIERATGNIIGFFDDDMLPDVGFIPKIRDVFISRPEVFGLVPYIYESNTAQVKGLKGLVMRFFEAFSGRKYFEAACRKNSFNSMLTDQIVEDVLANGCTFYRKEVFAKNQFAQWMQGYCYGEDVEFGLRVAQTHLVVGAGDIRVHHYHEYSGRDNQFSVSRMAIYNFARILNSAGRRGFGPKFFLVTRMSIGSLFMAIILAVKLKLPVSLAILTGSCCGIYDLIADSFKKDMDNVVVSQRSLNSE